MADDDEPTWQLPPEQAPPARVTPALFAAWRAARRGDANPEIMTNPVWAWLTRQPEVNAYQAARHFGVHGHGAPTWCNQRFGQSTTQLPDGRVLRIAGEHEDYYDPDFYIYNDVLVTEPDGTVAILGYSEQAFPPTDFHSASLTGDDLYVIGNLGYGHARRYDLTPVYRLDLSTLAFHRVDTVGEAPGWLHRHGAVVDGRTISVSGGKREVRLGDRKVLRDNGDDYRLDLDEGRWTRTTDRRWRQWELVRTDGTRGKVSEVRSLAWYRGLRDRDTPWVRSGEADALARLGFEPDLAAWAARFSPPLAHTVIAQDLEDEGAWRHHRVVIAGTTVRYVENDPVRVVVEGELSDAATGALLEDLAAKLSRVEGTTYTAVSLDP